MNTHTLEETLTVAGCVRRGDDVLIGTRHGAEYVRVSSVRHHAAVGAVVVATTLGTRTRHATMAPVFVRRVTR